MTPIKLRPMALSRATAKGRLCFVKGLLPALLVMSGVSVAQTCNDTIVKTAPNSRYTMSASLVTDNQTQLMWARCAQGQTFNGTTETCEGAASSFSWSGALSAANESSLAGHSDWRLPNIKELSSLVESACRSPAINMQAFPNTVSSSFWSSSPYANYSDDAWNVRFSNGYDGASYKLSNRYVRLVRGGQ